MSDDDRPLRVRVVEALKRHPKGLSTKDLESILKVPRYTVSPVVSKICMYGGPIEKVPGAPTHGAGTLWRYKLAADL